MQRLSKKAARLLFAIAGITIAACNNEANTTNTTTAGHKTDTIACLPGSSKLNIQTIEQVTGMKGTEKNGEYKITIPQNDLNIMVDGFKITPPMGLGTWAAFTPCADSAMVMGYHPYRNRPCPRAAGSYPAGLCHHCHSQPLCA